MYLGQPLDQACRTIMEEQVIEEYRYYECRDGHRVLTKQHSPEVISIRYSLNDHDLKTSRGIGIGSSKTDVLQHYGLSYYTRAEQGEDIVGYVDKKNNYTLEFWFSGDMVSSIRLDRSYLP